ncbi:hypothetical protein HMPREF1981_02994 [Bacteroides pyogenes F0041]|uniref:Uncharacterized protein n=1 Tax=Bacteroides pyogenes F0041 TaxID=1321819 RepID=U2CCS1_9BACE|nr:hypothetical protein HMPREF1981_02994 [Bacteroides pyogenes F0041]GAE20836.1 hypothetical protein JCM10003_215 [Bacteroides pyogenes JCM 10003]
MLSISVVSEIAVNVLCGVRLPKSDSLWSYKDATIIMGFRSQVKNNSDCRKKARRL